MRPVAAHPAPTMTRRIMLYANPLLRQLTLCLCLLATGTLAAEAPATLDYTVEGLDKPFARNLRLHLGRLDGSLSRKPLRLQRIVNRAVREALQPYGFYDATVRIEAGAAGTRIVVSAGPRMTWGDSRIEVDDAARALPGVQAILQRAPFRPGTPLSQPDYDHFREELLRSLRSLGFFDARYTERQLRIDRISRMATAVLLLDTGPRFHFGSIEITGTRLQAGLLLPLAPWRSGEGFDGDKLRRFEQRLRDTGYFDDVTLQMEQQAPDRVNVIVSATDVLRSRYDVGLGFSTDSSLRLRFNRHSPQLNARGDSLVLDSEFSAPRQTLEADWRIPHKDPLDDVFDLRAGLKGEDIEDTESTSATIGGRHTMRLPKDWSWSHGADVLFERYTIASESEKDVAFLMPVTSLARTRLDPGIDPLNGLSLWTAVDGSSAALGAPSDFLRWRARARWLQALPDDNTTVLLRTDLGAIWTDGFNQVPASLRFDAGGDQSIRGYDLDSLGPRDANGELLGGRYLAVGSVEISRRVAPRWRVAVFMDGGSAFTERHDDFYQSAGIGVRWLSPVGQIRVDFAMPVADAENSGFKIHISMGPPL